MFAVKIDVDVDVGVLAFCFLSFLCGESAAFKYSVRYYRGGRC